MTSTDVPHVGYRELGILAEGGMALVMRAVRESDGLDVVVKRVRPPLCFDAGFLRLFHDEGKLHAALDHEHIVRLLDQGEDAQGPYLVFEHVNGTDLGALLAHAQDDGRPLDIELVLAVAVPLAAALAFVHTATCDGCHLNAIHRDVSPANVLLSDDGAVKLADFGVAASRLKTEVTVAGELKGKFAYMAPEQTHGGPVTPQADLFAFGVLLWECLANARLFEAPTDADVVQQVRHREAPRLDDAAACPRPVEAPLVALVASLLAKEPSSRPSSAAAVRDALMAIAMNRGLDDGLRRIVAHAVRQAPRRELAPIAPDVRRRTQRVVGLSTADTVRRLPTRPSVRAAAVGAMALVAATVAFVLTRPPPLIDIPLPPVPPPVLSTTLPPPSPVMPPPPPPPTVEARPPPALLHRPPRPAPPPVSAPPAAAAEGFGRLSLSSEPWARVIIDGVVIARETPLMGFTLKAGRYEVTLENPVLGLSKRITVDVVADGEVRRFVDLQRP